MEELICKKKKTKGDKISWKKLYNLLFVNLKLKSLFLFVNKIFLTMPNFFLEYR